MNTTVEIVQHRVWHNGKFIKIDYRREMGGSSLAGYWSYRPEGFPRWIEVVNPEIRKLLDAGKHPREGMQL